MHALIDCVVAFHEATSMEVWYNNTSLHFDGFIVMKETKKRQQQLYLTQDLACITDLHKCSNSSKLSCSNFKSINMHTISYLTSKQSTNEVVNINLTKITFGFPTAHMLTFLSSPPVTITRPEDGPSDRHETLDPCATNSSALEKTHKNFTKSLNSHQ